MFLNFNIGNIEKGNINKLKFDEIIKYNYPMSSAHAKTAMEIIKLYFQNSYKGIVKLNYNN